MKLNKNFVERNLEKAKGARMFGVLLEELSQEELIACIAAGWSREQEAKERASKERNFLLNLRK